MGFFTNTPQGDVKIQEKKTEFKLFHYPPILDFSREYWKMFMIVKYLLIFYFNWTSG